MIDDVSVVDGAAVATMPCLTYSGSVHFVRTEVYIISALLSLAGVTWVIIRQTRDKLWTPFRVDREAM